VQTKIKWDAINIFSQFMLNISLLVVSRHVATDIFSL